MDEMIPVVVNTRTHVVITAKTRRRGVVAQITLTAQEYYHLLYVAEVRTMEEVEILLGQSLSARTLMDMQDIHRAFSSWMSSTTIRFPMVVRKELEHGGVS